MEDQGYDLVAAAFRRIQKPYAPKGEVWLGSKFLEKAGFDDSISGRLELAGKLKHDMICISVAEHGYYDPATGYRYFTVSDLEKLSKLTNLFLAPVIDGPFNRLSEKLGLMTVLTEWIRDKQKLLAEYYRVQKAILNLLSSCLEHSVHGVVIADDLAEDRSTFLNPRDIEQFFVPFYRRVVSEIHAANAFSLFHSCGKITDILPQLLDCGFDGLAAIEDEKNNLITLKAQYGDRLLLMGGIEGKILEDDSLSDSDFVALSNRVHILFRGGGFILSSSTGLYSDRFLEKIEAIYGALCVP